MCPGLTPFDLPLCHWLALRHHHSLICAPCLPPHLCHHSREQHKQQQRLAAAKQRAEATKAQVAAVAAAQAALRAAAAALLSAEKAEAAAKRTLEKEKQRQGLAGAREAERAEREAARLVRGWEGEGDEVESVPGHPYTDCV